MIITALHKNVMVKPLYHPSQSLLTGEEITFCGNISRSLKKDNYLVLETQARTDIPPMQVQGCGIDASCPLV